MAIVTCFFVVAPQGFEPRLPEPESDVLPLDQGAIISTLQLPKAFLIDEGMFLVPKQPSVQTNPAQNPHHKAQAVWDEST